MSNKIPAIILGLFVLLAVIYRISNPPSKVPPGPRGEIPNWTSSGQLGTLDEQSVSIDTSLWAGAWNQKQEGENRAAVRIVDFDSNNSKLTFFKKDAYIASLFWISNKIIRVLVLDADKMDKVKQSSIVDINANTGNIIKITKLPIVTMKIFAFTSDFNSYSALYKDQGGNAFVAVFDGSNSLVGRPVSIKLPVNASFSSIAAISKDKKSFIFSIYDKKTDVLKPYYLVNTVSGTPKKLFPSNDVPGKIEFASLSNLGVLIVASARDEFKTVVYDLADSKLINLNEYSKKAAILKDSQDIPKDMKFISYSSGYNYNPIEEKTTKLFTMKKSDQDEDFWRLEAQGGRLYPGKDNSYISISYSMGTADIRIIDKDGHLKKTIIARR